MRCLGTEATVPVVVVDGGGPSPGQRLEPRPAPGDAARHVV